MIQYKGHSFSIVNVEASLEFDISEFSKCNKIK